MNTVIRNAKINYYKQLLYSFKNYASNPWKHLSSCINRRHRTDIPMSTNTIQVAPLSENEFLSLLDKFKVTPTLFLFPRSCEEILKTYYSLSYSKATGFVGMKTIIIKLNIPRLAAPLTHIFNLSFSLGIYLSHLKKAIVIPVF